MTIDVRIENVAPRPLAAVRRTVRIAEIGRVWKPALDEVWAFLRTQPGLHVGGHNVFLYHRPATSDAPMAIDFGVEVIHKFDPAGEVVAAETPAGEVVSAVHVGPYDRLHETHDAIHAWRAAHQREFAGKSWEIYGDWTDDPRKLETIVVYLL